jgi:16S rRNA A1518/A1519 N6-dimethyltransferase RsmA/KsgA/DIM1 with predicted DNA glycosylase/AP lyase activity
VISKTKFIKNVTDSMDIFKKNRHNDIKTLLDIGGGSGTFAKKILYSFPKF